MRPAPERTTALSRLGLLYRHEVMDDSVPGRRHVIARLDMALRSERKRYRTDHWAYDRPRHVNLLAVHRREVAELEALTQAVAA